VLETNRRIFHITTGTILALLINYGILTLKEVFLLILLSIWLSFLAKHIRIPILHQVLPILERKQNLLHMPGIGVITFLAGTALALYLYSHTIAIASLLILTFGDGIAGLIGPHGTNPYFNPKKMWEGIIAGILIATIFAQLLVPIIPALIASTIAMLLEGLDLRIGSKKIDDNLLIPVVAGAVLTFLS